MKKAWEYFYEEYLDKSKNDVNKELDAKLEKVHKLLDEIQANLAEINDLIGSSEASIEEAAFEAGFKCGSESK